MLENYIMTQFRNRLISELSLQIFEQCSICACGKTCPQVHRDKSVSLQALWILVNSDCHGARYREEGAVGAHQG